MLRQPDQRLFEVLGQRFLPMINKPTVRRPEAGPRMRLRVAVIPPRLDKADFRSRNPVPLIVTDREPIIRQDSHSIWGSETGGYHLTFGSVC